MATLDDVYRQRWNMIDPSIVYVPQNGIPSAWRRRPEWGSPIGPEIELDDGSVAQAFAGGIVRWTANAGAELVTE